MHVHPVAFGSKCSSRLEERYKPYLLEFTGLKFGLDKFGDLTYGSPVEVETDCQACYLTILWMCGIVLARGIVLRMGSAVSSPVHPNTRGTATQLT